MTQTATIAATPTTSFVETLNLTDAKAWQAGQENVFSLHKYNRVRIESHPLFPNELETVEMTQGDAKEILSWLTELDVRGLLQAEPDLEKFKTLYTVSYETTRNCEVSLRYDGAVEVYSWIGYFPKVSEHRACALLKQADLLQFMAWLQEFYSVKQDLH